MKVSQTAYCGLFELQERYKENRKIVEEEWHCRDGFVWWLGPHSVISNFSGVLLLMFSVDVLWIQIDTNLMPFQSGTVLWVFHE